MALPSSMAKEVEEEEQEEEEEEEEEEGGDATFQELLEGTVAAELIGGEPLVVLPADSTVGDVMGALTDNTILSTPLANKETNKFTGVVDVRDVAAFLVRVVREVGPNPEAVVERVVRSPVSHVTGLASSTILRPLPPSASVLAVLELMVHKGVRRLPLVHTNGQVMGVLTQSDLVRFVARHVESLGDLTTLPVRTCIEWGCVLTVPESSPALEAFSLIVEKNVGGVAVLGTEGQLVDNISVSDLRALGAGLEHLSLLFGSVKEFLSVAHRVNMRPHNHMRALTCDASGPFVDALVKFTATFVHRLYITEGDAGSLVGVMDLQKALAVVLSASVSHQHH